MQYPVELKSGQTTIDLLITENADGSLTFEILPDPNLQNIDIRALRFSLDIDVGDDANPNIAITGSDVSDFTLDEGQVVGDSTSYDVEVEINGGQGTNLSQGFSFKVTTFDNSPLTYEDADGLSIEADVTGSVQGPPLLEGITPEKLTPDIDISLSAILAPQVFDGQLYSLNQFLDLDVPPIVVSGERNVWQVAVTNTGETVLNDLEVTIPFSSRVTLESSSDYVINGSTVTADIETLAIGDTAKILVYGVLDANKDFQELIFLDGELGTTEIDNVPNEDLQRFAGAPFEGKINYTDVLTIEEQNGEPTKIVYTTDPISSNEPDYVLSTLSGSVTVKVDTNADGDLNDPDDLDETSIEAIDVANGVFWIEKNDGETGAAFVTDWLVEQGSRTSGSRTPVYGSYGLGFIEIFEAFSDLFSPFDSENNTVTFGFLDGGSLGDFLTGGSLGDVQGDFIVVSGLTLVVDSQGNFIAESLGINESSYVDAAEAILASSPDAVIDVLDTTAFSGVLEIDANVFAANPAIEEWLLASGEVTVDFGNGKEDVLLGDTTLTSEGETHLILNLGKGSETNTEVTADRDGVKLTVIGDNGKDTVLFRFGDNEDDAVQGGKGQDTVEFEGVSLNDVSITGTVSQFVVSGTGIGTNTLVDIEFLQLNDGLFAVADLV